MCKATLKSGKQCPYKAKGNSSYCGIHSHKATSALQQDILYASLCDALRNTPTSYMQQLMKKHQEQQHVLQELEKECSKNDNIILQLQERHLDQQLAMQDLDLACRNNDNTIKEQRQVLRDLNQECNK